MTLETLTSFFAWSTAISLVIYGITAVMSIFARDIIYALHKTWFDMSRQVFDIVIYSYLGIFKILLIVFIFVPYLALLAMD